MKSFSANRRILVVLLLTGAFLAQATSPARTQTPAPLEIPSEPTASPLTTPAAETPPPPPMVPSVPEPYQTEQEWIIASVCRNIYELISFAADKRGEVVALSAITLSKTNDEPPRYDVTLTTSHGTVQASLAWPGSIWAEDAYLPFCKACGDFLKYTPPSPAITDAQGNVLHDLLSFSQTSIKKESERISAWIEKEPSNPIAQEDAALVLGTLAMKENSGRFWDPRDACNHVTSHLAVALYFEPSLQIDGQLADCLVGLIMDTKVICADQIDKLAAIPNPPPDLAAWLSAARLRNTRDWTAMVFPEQGSGLEQVEYFRALAEAIGPDHAVFWLQKGHLADRIDWARIVLQLQFSVECGHIFALPAVGKELRAMQLTFPGQYKEQVVDDLNQIPGGALTVGDNHIQVISPGMWAQFFQRHLCHAMDQDYDFIARKWGVPDQAKEVREVIKVHFSGLFLFPYLNLDFEPKELIQDDFDAASKAFSAHPEFAPDWLAKSDFGADKVSLTRWFSPPIPHGTAFGCYSRFQVFIAGSAQADQMAQQIYKIAPLALGADYLELNRRSSGNQDHTVADAKAVFGPMLNYYMPAMDAVLSSTDIAPADKEALTKREAELDPEKYFDLAAFYNGQNNPDLEAQAYQNYFDKGSDRVAVSNSMDFLVNYYFDHGQKDKALQIAQACADVYSYRGLETLLKLKERMGDLDAAEDLGQKIKERYNDSTALNRFYQRQISLGKTEYQAKMLTAPDASVFPNGMVHVTLSSFQGAPTHGAMLIGESESTKRFGMEPNYVIVALNGYATNDQIQYDYVRGLSDDPNMTLIVWDGSQYKEINVNLPGRHFGTGLGDYPPAAK